MSLASTPEMSARPDLMRPSPFRVLPEPLAFTTGTRPERWFVVPLLFIALAGLGVIAAEGVYLAAGGPVTLG